MSAGEAGRASWEARVYGWPLRIVIGALLLISSASLPVILALLLRWDQPPIPHVRTFFEARLMLRFSLLPFLLAALLRWLCRARVREENETWIVAGRTRRIEIPRASVARLVPWRLPVPGPGFWLEMRSGRRLGYGFEPLDLAVLSRAEHPPDTIAARLLAYSRARAAVVWRWYHLLFKFGVYPLVPGLLVFRLYQFLTFGGPFAEYYLSGLRPYLRSLVLVTGGIWMDCILGAGSVRVATEAIALVLALFVPAAAAGTRRVLEVLASLIYYGGIAALVVHGFVR